jgi:hypothetical protein
MVDASPNPDVQPLFTLHTPVMVVCLTAPNSATLNLPLVLAKVSEVLAILFLVVEESKKFLLFSPVDVEKAAPTPS